MSRKVPAVVAVVVDGAVTGSYRYTTLEDVTRRAGGSGPTDLDQLSVERKPRVLIRQLQDLSGAGVPPTVPELGDQGRREVPPVLRPRPLGRPDWLPFTASRYAPPAVTMWSAAVSWQCSASAVTTQSVRPNWSSRPRRTGISLDFSSPTSYPSTVPGGVAEGGIQERSMGDRAWGCPYVVRQPSTRLFSDL